MFSPKKSKYIFSSNRLEEELTCAICLNILKDPLTTVCCRNTFCSQCIIRCLESDLRRCPTCRTNISAQSLAKPSLIVTNILSDLKVVCDYHSNGCQSTLTTEQMNKHLTECSYNLKNGFESTLTSDYVMFGTFKTESKDIKFTKEGIKLTNVVQNCGSYLTPLTCDIMILFVDINELMYCSDESRDLLFIKPSLLSNLKIRQSIYLGNYSSANGLKFDIKSNDSREHYLIIVLKEKVDTIFVENLNKYSKDVNQNIRFSTLSREEGNDMLLNTRMASLALQRPISQNRHRILTPRSLRTPTTFRSVRIPRINR